MDLGHSEGLFSWFGLDPHKRTSPAFLTDSLRGTPTGLHYTTQGLHRHYSRPSHGQL